MAYELDINIVYSRQCATELQKWNDETIYTTISYHETFSETHWPNSPKKHLGITPLYTIQTLTHCYNCGVMVIARSSPYWKKRVHTTGFILTPQLLHFNFLKVVIILFPIHFCFRLECKSRLMCEYIILCGSMIIVGEAAISPRIVLVPIVPDPFFGRSAAFLRKIVGNLRALSRTTLYLRGKIWRDRLSPPRVGYRKSDRLLFLNMLKNSSRSKTVGPWSSWSSEGPLKVPLSRAYFRILAPRKRVDRARNVRDSSPRHGPLVGTQSGQKRGRLGGIQDDNRADQKNWIIGDNLDQIGPIGKKQSLVKCSL